VQIESLTFNLHGFSYICFMLPYNYIPRAIATELEKYRQIFPVIALLGPRQCGKSTLIKKEAASWGNCVYLDLQDEQDANKLTEPALFFENNAKSIICIDEIQLKPELFSILRSVVDKNRVNGKLILLGSASRDLIQQSSETLAGRIGYLQLTPFTIDELGENPTFELTQLWMRGGFPESYLAQNESFSDIWRENFIRTFIERDIPQLGFGIPALKIRRFLTMCAHNQGQLLNLSKLAGAMNLTHPTIKNYIDILEQTFLLRSVPPYEANVKKRLVKTPKVYIRDTGILHSLLGIKDFNALLGNPVFGASWEGLVIENIIANTEGCEHYFFRTATGDELDLIIEKGTKRIAIECKASRSPKPGKGFWQALDIVQPVQTIIIAPISGSAYFLKDNIQVAGLSEGIELVRNWLE
jgi:predicted AAA+ superfamily ATPase